MERYKKCKKSVNKSAHAKNKCSMAGMENLQLPDEIVLKIFGYLNLGQLIQCARVSKRFNNITKDESLKYTSMMLAMKDLTAKDRKVIIDILIVRPKVKKVKISEINWDGDLQRIIYGTSGTQYIYIYSGLW